MGNGFTALTAVVGPAEGSRRVSPPVEDIGDAMFICMAEPSGADCEWASNGGNRPAVGPII